jgi:hypothetical protein
MCTTHLKSATASSGVTTTAPARAPRCTCGRGCGRGGGA